MAQIAVVGTGCVGLTTGACLASLGHDIECVEFSEKQSCIKLRLAICW